VNITIVKPKATVLTSTRDLAEQVHLAEIAGRTCYKSESKGDPNEFLKRLVKSGHESVIEHISIVTRIICDRSCSHQIVRHRLCEYSQESQRYCDYGKLGFQVILPPKIGNMLSGTYQCSDDPPRKFARLDEQTNSWLRVVFDAYQAYCKLRKNNVPAEDARSVLPNATKTEIVMTANARQWRHIFDHRALNPRAQWQIRELMQSLLVQMNGMIPCIFSDLFERLQEMRDG